jgi:hypothetical protein
MFKLAVIAFFASTQALIGTCVPMDRSARAGSLVRAPITEVRDMQQNTVYKGRNIRLSAKPNAGGTWTGVAQFLDDPGRVVETDASFGGQSEAIKAALSRAMAIVDQERMLRGKP